MKFEKLIRLLFLLLCIGVLISCSKGEGKESSVVKFEAASIEKSDEDSEIVTAPLEYTKISVSEWEKYTKDNKDKLIVATTFASWCSICRAEAPKLVKTVLQYKNNSNIIFVGLNAQDTLSGLKKHVKEFNIEHKVFIVKDKLLDSLRIQAVPVTVYYYGGVEVKRDISTYGKTGGFTESIESIRKRFSIE